MAAFGRRAGDQPGHHGIPGTPYSILGIWLAPPECGRPVFASVAYGAATPPNGSGQALNRRCGFAALRAARGSRPSPGAPGRGTRLTPLRHSAGQSQVGGTFLWVAYPRKRSKRIRRHEKAGRPLGNDGFVGKLEETLGRILQRQKPGRKRRHKQKQVYCPPITRLVPGSQLPLEGHALFERELNT